jgi:DNA polymerase V
MNEKLIERTAYSGTKNFTQQNVKTANASGFGAATDDFMERGIDLNEMLINNKPATYFFRMNSDAMQGVGIYSNDVLIVDRSLKANSGKIIVAAINGELLVRRFEKGFNKAILSADNKRYKDIEINEFTEFLCWGVVTYVIHSLNPVSGCKP